MSRSVGIMSQVVKDLCFLCEGGKYTGVWARSRRQLRSRGESPRERQPPKQASDRKKKMISIALKTANPPSTQAREFYWILLNFSGNSREKSGFCRRICLGRHFLAPRYQIFVGLFAESTGGKHWSHTRLPSETLCVGCGAFCRRISLGGHSLAPFYRVHQRACLHPSGLGLILKSCGLNHRNAVLLGCNTHLGARYGAISFLFGCSQHSKWPIPADSDSEGARVPTALIGSWISLLHFYMVPLIFFANLKRV